MKKLVVLIIAGFGVWGYYQEQKQPGSVVSQFESTFNSPAPAQDFSRFRCDGREHCSQMTSRAEAVYFINNCPNTRMDGDNDGDPCENDSRF